MYIRAFNPTVVPEAQIPYNLEAVTKIKDDNFVDAKTSMCSYISQTIGVRVTRGSELVLSPHLTSIPTTELKKPDGNVMYAGASILIFELESNSDWASTIFKLAIQLAKMLLSLRNRKTSSGTRVEVDALSGFYFPSKSF